MDTGDYGSVEQSLRWRVAPILVLARKFDIGKMACDASHCDFTLAQRLSKVKIKRVILDVLISCIVLFEHYVRAARMTRTMRLTVCMLPPDKWPATALDIEGFSATHKTFMVVQDTTAYMVRG